MHEVSDVVAYSFKYFVDNLVLSLISELDLHIRPSMVSVTHFRDDILEQPPEGI